jgi:hypothetical protein
MWLTPSRSQWAQWSLPSKLGAIGAWVGILALSLYLAEKGCGLIARDDSEKEAARLRAELAATRAALDIPKAEIEGSLGEVGLNMENLGVKETLVRPELDGTVRFTITLANKSKVQAKSGSVYLRICQTCEFAEEPRGFHQQASEMNQDRKMDFQTLDAHAAFFIPLRIRPPAIRQFAVGVDARCENCVFHLPESLLIRY